MKISPISDSFPMFVPIRSFDITYTQTIQNQREIIHKIMKKKTLTYLLSGNYLAAIPTIVWIAETIAEAKKLKEKII